MGQVIVSHDVPIPVPGWTVTPYGDRSACWGCGLDADVLVGHWPEPRGYCVYCDELRRCILGGEPGFVEARLLLQEPQTGPLGGPSGVSPIPPAGRTT